jgi:N-acylneuraminate cytidylyltransferase/CMP-N,N'-diacetyllegionaminic acid synthase
LRKERVDLYHWQQGEQTVREGRGIAVKRLCTICARGGSKGVPGKNIRPLAGKPLLAHSLEQARDCGLFERLAVSSDSPEILAVAQAWGADLLLERPPALATDTAGKLPAIRHAWQAAEALSGERFEQLVDLDCTAPLRLPADIVGAVRLLETSGAGNVITGTPAHRSPYFNLVEVGAEDGVVRLSKPLPDPVRRRQDAPACYDMNASIYVWRREPFLSAPYVFGPDTRLFAMPRVRSLDIDAEEDFLMVPCLWAHRSPAP